MKAGRFGIPLLALLLAGCGGGDSSPASAEESVLRGRTFLSTSVTENGQPRPLAEGTVVRFRFTDDARLLADAGCNTIAGPVNPRGGRLEVHEPSSTGIGCDQFLHDQDTWLGEFLATTPSWRLDGADLVVSSGGTEIAMLDRAVAEPNLALAGTRWTVDTLVEGEVASSTPAGAPATLLFEQDTVTVDTGCNTGSGGYRATGDRITFDPIATTKIACEADRAALETAVLAVLSGEVSYTIESDVLSLRQQSGKGLRLRGQRS